MHRAMVRSVIGVAFMAAGASANARDLTIVAWGGVGQEAQRAAFFDPYTKATGKVVLEDQTPVLAKIRSMVESGNVTWDLVDQESAEVMIGCEEGLFEKIDWSQIDRSKYAEHVHSDCGYGIYTAGNVLAYDGNRLKDNPPKSWADFFDTKKYPGKRGLWNTPKGALEVALMADGVPPAEVYKVLRTPEGVDRAFAKLDTIKPDILLWSSGSEFLSRLASGEYVMTYAWNGRIPTANKSDKKNLKIAWDAGYTYVTDQLAIVKGSPNAAQAMDYIKFIHQHPELQAEYAKRTYYSSTSLASLDYLSPEVKEQLPLIPERLKYGVAVDDEFWVENLDSLTERFNVWAAQ
ncbi:ABC transporter substrate-binding protein [Rhodoligotrophos defluvii]|uniref:ABC transporter substrate-binding protein n=1 Tax=Rhodoligotrophos defluvii TaxID=2561934 RepID=UPI0010C9CED4|nr:ABC transporter substrate-binding protein [Rhodoligotrophos defluvii]